MYCVWWRFGPLAPCSARLDVGHSNSKASKLESENPADLRSHTVEYYHYSYPLTPITIRLCILLRHLPDVICHWPLEAVWQASESALLVSLRHRISFRLAVDIQVPGMRRASGSVPSDVFRFSLSTTVHHSSHHRSCATLLSRNIWINDPFRNRVGMTITSTCGLERKER